MNVDESVNFLEPGNWTADESNYQQPTVYGAAAYPYGGMDRDHTEHCHFPVIAHGQMPWQASGDVPRPMGETRSISRGTDSYRRKKLREAYVYLYSPQRDQIPPVSDITSRIAEVLLQRDIVLIPETIIETPVPEEARPAILLCVNVSRLGTDVSNALKDVRAEENVAVVVLHHKDVHVLPKLSSEKSLTGAEFQDLGAIVDMAFWKEKGLHQCDINQTAIMKLADFLTEYAIP